MQVAFSKPDAVKLDKFLRTKKDLDFSYPQPGKSFSQKVEGYDNDHHSIYLGNSDHIWEKAKNGLKNWQQFPPAWTRIYPDKTSLKNGNSVVVMFRIFGIWWINAARIVFAFDDTNRFGFAYGTLPGHIESGEECFWIERNQNGDIHYHIRAFSKPAYWYIWLAYPLARMFQRRFVKQSLQRMKNLTNYP